MSESVLMEQPFFAILLWPFIHVIKMIFSDNNEQVKTAKVGMKFNIMDHLGAICSSIQSFLIAYFCMYYLFDEYPAFKSNIAITFDWTSNIIIRNLLGSIIICGLWDYILYFSPLKKKLHKYKFNKKYPNIKQLKHDIFYTLIASTIAGLLEILYCYLCSNNYLNCESDIMTSPIFNFLIIIFVAHWRQPHFYIIHRFLHPWKLDIIPDFGIYLYKYVHSLHHKSYNPTAFSGTSMHTIESFLYYTAAFMLLPFNCHPIITLTCIVHLALAAWFSHDGFQWPGTGDYFHQLHHAHFDCNYGSNFINIDKLFGTFVGSKEELSTIWKEKAKTTGRVANESWSKVHED